MRAEIPACQNAPRHRHDLTALLESTPSRDERSAALGRLDHDDGQRQPADNAVSQRKMLRSRGCPGQQLADQRTVGRDRRCEGGMFSRVHDIRPRSQDGHGPAGGREGGSMRG